MAQEEAPGRAFYGVFTEGREPSGVYEDWAEVRALLERAAGHGEPVTHRMFEDRQAAVGFIAAETRQAAAAGVVVPGVLVR
eukprot:4972101-Prymnesium_polylepis.2